MEETTKTQSLTQKDALLREFVPIEDFEKITEQIPKEIKAAKNIFDSSEDKPIIAQLLGDIILDRDTPNEAKLIVFKEAINLIEPITYGPLKSTEEQQKEIKTQFEANVAIAQTLINILRAEPSNLLRIRMAALISHGLQPKYALKGISYDGTTPLTPKQQEQERLFEARLQAFQSLAFHEDDTSVESRWAHSLLYPTEKLQIFNAIYDLNTTLVTTPKITEEVTEIAERIEYSKNDSENELTFTGHLVNLPYGYFPSPEKVAEYYEKTGRSLPIRIVREMGAKFISIDFPSDLSRKAHDTIQAFREGRIQKREEVISQLRDLYDEFLNRMNPEQRENLLNSSVNIELRLTTTRDSKIDQEKSTTLEDHIPSYLDTSYSEDFAAD